MSDPCIRFPDASASLDEVHAAVAVVAERVAGHARVAVLARPTLTTAVAVLGALRAGVPVVPVAADTGASELAHVVRDSGLEAWVGHGPSDPQAPVLPVDVTARGSSSLPEPAADAEALVLYTSGTTGPPKGVVHTHASIAADLDALAEAWAWGPQDHLVHGLPLYHVHGLVLGVLGAVRVGCALTHTGRPTPQAYAAARGSLYFGVPTVWHRVVEDGDVARALASARLLVSGSAPLPAPVFTQLAALTDQAPVERYGMTETLITISTRADGERRPGYVGWPVHGIRSRLRDEDGNDVAHDGTSVGRLELQGPTMFRGYLGRPEASAQAWTEDGWLRTGDVATVGRDGCHRIVGRESVDLIKTGGYRVGAGEVETELLAHPALAEAAVVGVPDDDLGQRIVAVVVPRAGERVDPGELIAWVAERLSVHKRPREVRVASALPRNAMGKVIKADLR